MIAESYERIHRSNLVGMGIIPLQFRFGENAETLKLTGHEIYDIDIPQNCKPLQEVQVKVNNKLKQFLHPFIFLIIYFIFRLIQVLHSMPFCVLTLKWIYCTINMEAF